MERFFVQYENRTSRSCDGSETRLEESQQRLPRGSILTVTEDFDSLEGDWWLRFGPFLRTYLYEKPNAVLPAQNPFLFAAKFFEYKNRAILLCAIFFFMDRYSENISNN
ncbi:MAG TPA: hypothetical protein VF837_00905 [Patescibacteria group bacterium]